MLDCSNIDFLEHMLYNIKGNIIGLFVFFHYNFIKFFTLISFP